MKQRNKRKTIHYDIFISYRRSSYDTANLIATRLRAAGYSVFFDMETLRSGKFNVQLYEVIDNCKDFVVVLPPNALDRCVNEDDWVRLEVCRAMAADKNIIPVMLNGFTWPNPMPTGMEDLCEYQALTASSIEYFDMALERLQKRYLTSKSHIAVARLLKVSSIVVLSLLSVIAILWGVFLTLSKDVCTKYATEITQDAGYVHMIADENQRVKRDWEEFNKTYEYKHSPERIAAMQESMLNRIESTEQILKQLWTVESTPMTVTPYHSFLLSLHGINSEEIALSPAFATLHYNDYMEQLSRIRTAIMEPSALNRRFVNTLFEVFDHTLNSYYVSLLSELSLFPKNSRKTFNKMRPQWSYFPQSYNIDQDREYYEDIIETENRLANELLAQYRSVLMEQDSELEDIIRENEELKQKVNKALKNSEVERTQKEHDAEIAMRQEKIKAKESIVKASEAELAELDKQYIEVYNTLKEKCHINADDEQSYKWGKIRRWGNYINMLVESRQSLEEQGIHSSSTITPNMAYENMRTMLSSYQSNHPESADYITATNLFFKELSLGSREYAGVLIFAFKDNAEHPFFNIGDIVVEYNGKTIKDYNEFKAAYNENASAKVGLLRVVNGRFEKVTHPMEASDIVGFIDLTE